MMSIKLSGIIITEAFFGIKLSEKYYNRKPVLTGGKYERYIS